VLCKSKRSIRGEVYWHYRVKTVVRSRVVSLPLQSLKMARWLGKFYSAKAKGLSINRPTMPVSHEVFSSLLHISPQHFAGYLNDEVVYPK
jgi:hypothetical protein